MLPETEAPSKVALSSEDLNILEQFLDAWCEENGVDRTDAAARKTASSLIDWYQKDDKYHSRIAIGVDSDLSLSPRMEQLLRQLT